MQSSVHRSQSEFCGFADRVASDHQISTSADILTQMVSHLAPLCLDVPTPRAAQSRSGMHAARRGKQGQCNKSSFVKQHAGWTGPEKGAYAPENK